MKRWSTAKAIGLCVVGLVAICGVGQPAFAQDDGYYDNDGRVLVSPEDAAPAEDGFQPVWVQQLRELKDKEAAAHTQQLSNPNSGPAVNQPPSKPRGKRQPQ